MKNTEKNNKSVTSFSVPIGEKMGVSRMVILTNQITTHLSRALASQADLVSPADDLSLSEGTSGSSCVTAALGTTWSHSVNTRLILQCLGSERRQILIAKSPLAPFTSFAYTIKKEGLVLQGQQKP
ncbi:DNA repair protein RAD51 homolog 2-like [Leptonychotes weddellii]|uniref:DNA repair protein RAD51 homolog 2-like n=1 Tax=Leptonychotes weddellii TaxID=9713 RepID=A0A7F8RAQ5_LEPWE|nr:DNA repair protein RAD51 homolog 2-like [Leptonychotes weddellii]